MQMSATVKIKSYKSRRSSKSSAKLVYSIYIGDSLISSLEHRIRGWKNVNEKCRIVLLEVGNRALKLGQ